MDSSNLKKTDTINSKTIQEQYDSWVQSNEQTYNTEPLADVVDTFSGPPTNEFLSRLEKLETRLQKLKSEFTN